MVPVTGLFLWTRLGPLSWGHLAITTPDSKVHGAKMRPIWGRQDPGGPHVGPMNFAIWDNACKQTHKNIGQCIIWSHKEWQCSQSKTKHNKTYDCRAFVLVDFAYVLLDHFKVTRLRFIMFECGLVLADLPISCRVTLKPLWQIWDRLHQSKTIDDISAIKQRNPKSYVYFMGYTVHILKVTLFMPLEAHVYVYVYIYIYVYVYVYVYVYTGAVKNIMAECILPAAVVGICQFRVELKVSHGNIQRWKPKAIDRCDVSMCEIIASSILYD